jgi:hypothetical protein
MAINTHYKTFEGYLNYLKTIPLVDIKSHLIDLKEKINNASQDSKDLNNEQGIALINKSLLSPDLLKAVNDSLDIIRQIEEAELSSNMKVSDIQEHLKEDITIIHQAFNDVVEVEQTFSLRLYGDVSSLLHVLRDDLFVLHGNDLDSGFLFPEHN